MQARLITFVRPGVRSSSRCLGGGLALRAAAALLAVLSGPATGPMVRGDLAPHVEPPAEATRADPTAAVAGDDDVWVVSTRRLPDIARMPLTAGVAVERHVPLAGGGGWIPADLDALFADPAVPLCVFIHGNRYEPADARAQGLRLARHLAARHPTPPRVRTVVLSWPSGRTPLPLRDGRLKYDRAHSDAHYLAWLLGRIEPTRPVAIVAYSFGTIIALEALEDLVAAERRGRSDVQPWSGRAGPTHLVFVAAAVRCDALAPAGPYRRAVDCVDRVTLVLNSEDNALRFFPCLDRQVRADALGFVGMPRRWLPPDIEFSATDAASIVGRNHGLTHYLASPVLTGRIAAAAFDGLTP